MSPNLRNIAIALALLGLLFWGYKQQLHLPKPSLNPFDDQWEMRTSWLRNNCDSIVWGSCGYFDYEIDKGVFRVGYQSSTESKKAVHAKSLLIPADTVKIISNGELRKLNGAPVDSTYSANFNYQLLDSVCSYFGYSPIGLKKPHVNSDYGPHYISQNTRDTINFYLFIRRSSNDSFLIRDFKLYIPRDREMYPYDHYNL